MSSSRKDDIDDILSGIMHGSNQAEKPRSEQRPAENKSEYSPPHKEKPYKNNVRHSKGKVVRYLLLFIVLGLAIAGIVFGASKLAPNLLSPSPFSEEVKKDIDFSLYYPANLPEGFKIETDSIQQADQGVVIYAISNDSGKRITVSIQKMPENIDLNKIYENLSNVYEVDTDYGKVKVGQDENILIGNVNAEGTWLLINTPNGNVSTDELNTVLSSLKKG